MFSFKRSSLSNRLIVGVVIAVLLIAPYWLNTALLQTGLFVFGSVIAALGLHLLSGVAGQVSLGQSFFVGLGAYAYAFFSGETTGEEAGRILGWGIAPIGAAVLAVAVAGLVGLLFSPVAMRLSHLYLALVTLSLVFIGQHVLTNLTLITGGFHGRDVPPFSVLGLNFDDVSPSINVLGVPFGHYEKLWYLSAVIAVASFIVAVNIQRSRAGRALQAIRDSETAAAVMGVNIRNYKAGAFIISSMYAGLAGVLFALALGTMVPETFGFMMSVNLLLAIVLGGMGSAVGAALGATFIFGFPLVLAQYSDLLAFLAAPGSGGIDAANFSQYLFGALVIVVFVAEPQGLGVLASRIRDRLSPHSSSAQSPELGPDLQGIDPGLRPTAKTSRK